MPSLCGAGDLTQALSMLNKHSINWAVSPTPRFLQPLKSEMWFVSNFSYVLVLILEHKQQELPILVINNLTAAMRKDEKNWINMSVSNCTWISSNVCLCDTGKLLSPSNVEIFNPQVVRRFDDSMERAEKTQSFEMVLMSDHSIELPGWRWFEKCDSPSNTWKYNTVMYHHPYRPKLVISVSDSVLCYSRQ